MSKTWGDLLRFFDLSIKSVKMLQKGAGPEGARHRGLWQEPGGGLRSGLGQSLGKEKGRWIGHDIANPWDLWSIFPSQKSRATVIVNLPPSPTLSLLPQPSQRIHWEREGKRTFYSSESPGPDFWPVLHPLPSPSPLSQHFLPAPRHRLKSSE